MWEERSQGMIAGSLYVVRSADSTPKSQAVDNKDLCGAGPAPPFLSSLSS